MADRAALFAEHHRGLFRYFCRAVGQAEAARDLTQDVFLRATRAPGPATSNGGLKAWLFRIARNLALDYHRRVHGRFRIFESVARLPLLDQLVFRRRYRDRFSLEETLASLRPQLPALTFEAVAAADQRLGAVLTSRQRFAMAVERPRIEPLLTTDESDGRPPLDPPASGPSPEDVLAGVERRSRLRAALATLSPSDRLLVRLRLEQELTLAEVAVIAGFTGPQQADRRLREVYARLRAMLA